MGVLRLTMAQALLKFLDQQYVERDGKETKFVKGVMGIFGHGNVLGIGEALEREPGNLQFIQGKNEQGMTHAAVAYAKQKNRLEIFACTSSIGPGALNMVTAAATATVNRIPVLLLPGDIFACRQPDPVLQQIEHPMDYTISANDAFKPVSKYWDRITRPEQLMSSMMQAMRVLTDPAETGAVTICLPQDVQTEAYDYPEHFFAKRVHSIDRMPVSKSACDRAVQLLSRKKTPLLIAGGGVHYSLAYEPLLQFAEAFGIPIAETQAGKSAVPWHHPLYMGGIGTTGSLAANQLAKEADAIICVGTRLGDFATASKSAFHHPGVEFIHININNFDAGKMNGVKLVADAAEALKELTDVLLARGYKSSYDAAELAAKKAEWNREVDRLYAVELEQGLSQTRVLGEINRFMDGHEVIVAAAGSLPGDLHRLWRAERPKSYHMEYGFSCMGYEVAGAFGVKLAEPDQEVYALIGDGSYLMLHSELVTSLQEGVKVNVILLDNHGFQCIHNLQKDHGSDGFGNEFRYRSREMGGLTGDYIVIDYASHARSMGATAYTVTSIEQLRDALHQAKQEKSSTLIAVQVLPGTNSGGYESWWRVDVPEVSSSDQVQRAYQRMHEKTNRALKI
ncbi:3D-(3,5/4)-trihydroxycyclohexane-1,2-dione acylhydrolase (decyclizing) [Paenibacillus terrigena]|uniref:3D-(3,5/4)-trihydroxycyclohexane-1,2-dione acylhydrolase (decyclizing) n=1 Tax=Paenibacillus terrigena TaxID=369333 RepID=UPI0028D307DF|nr:3D-(3,5/4)-trihydroxycyclohexane-1,2-dione acylhydrolase (decyclizing) [Paenibacillus terrigena]